MLGFGAFLQKYCKRKIPEGFRKAFRKDFSLAWIRKIPEGLRKDSPEGFSSRSIFCLFFVVFLLLLFVFVVSCCCCCSCCSCCCCFFLFFSFLFFFRCLVFLLFLLFLFLVFVFIIIIAAVWGRAAGISEAGRCSYCRSISGRKGLRHSSCLKAFQEPSYSRVRNRSNPFP